MTEFIEIDGSEGEGGGQILRTALGLSIATGRPFRIARIRAGRERPGLMRQHLTAVQAARDVGSAEVKGAELGSLDLEFRPGAVRTGEFHFAVGTAGSATLVLQTVLPPLLTRPEPSRLVLSGGTHNPFAPPFDFIATCFAPRLREAGIDLDLALDAHGFFPAGGGRMTVDVRGAASIRPFEILRRGEIVRRTVRPIVARLPRHVAHREADRAVALLGWSSADVEIVEVKDSPGPGNVLILEAIGEFGGDVVVGFGERGRTAEAVADAAVAEMRRYLASGAPVGEYLADQLVVPMALAGAGVFRTVKPSRHLLTNIETVKRFLDVAITVERDGGGPTWIVRCG